MVDKPEDVEDIVEEAQRDAVAASEVTLKQDEERDRWEAFADKAQELVLTDAGLRQATGTMVAAKQLYCMALRDMENRTDALDSGGEDKARLKELYLEIASVQAGEPFDEVMLLQGIAETVVPWVESVSKEHTELEAKLKHQEIAEAEQTRRAGGISLGMECLPEHKIPDELNRTRTLTLVGWKPAVLWVVNRILEHTTSPEAFAAGTAPKQTIVLTREGGEHRDPRIMSIGDKGWDDCANSNNSWGRKFQETYLDHLHDPLDLFVVLDLPHAYKGYAFQSEATKAAEAQKKLRKWATLMGSAFIGTVLLESQNLPDFKALPWESLRLFTYLRAVTVEEKRDGYYDITVGRFTKIEGVPKEEVDAFTTGNIITP